jgi:8-oxo-dGTP pyrophosphatase MutT (NUDIX family)
MSARNEGVFVVILMKTENHSLRVLLQLRKNTGLHDGKFGFPGGKCKDNESSLKAALRELYEETGLVVDGGALQRLYRCGGRDHDGTEWRGTFYFCVVDYCYGKALVKEPGKHDRIGWYPVDKLPKNAAPAVLKVFSDLKAYIHSSSSGKANVPSPTSDKTKPRIRKPLKIVVPALLEAISNFKTNIAL